VTTASRCRAPVSGSANITVTATGTLPTHSLDQEPRRGMTVTTALAFAQPRQLSQHAINATQTPLCTGRGEGWQRQTPLCVARPSP
jgi:hypothetical protein